MQQSYYQFHFHPFSQGQGAYLHIHQFLDPEQLHKVLLVFLILPIRKTINLFKQMQSILCGQFKEKLALLPHYYGILPFEVILQFIGIIAHHANFTGSGGNDAGKHFNESGFSCPVRADQANKPALFHGKIHAFYRLFFFIFPVEQAFYTA